MFRYACLLLILISCSSPRTEVSERTARNVDSMTVATAASTTESRIPVEREQGTIEKKALDSGGFRSSLGRIPFDLTRLDIGHGSSPSVWTFTDSAVGDLNRDGRADHVYVLESDPVPPVLAHRVLFVFLSRGDQYVEEVQSATAIPTGAAADWFRGRMLPQDDPFEGIEINNGCIDIHWSNVGNGGRWWSYRFRHQQGHFALIGATHGEGNATHFNSYDYNLNTGVLLIRRETGEGDSPEVRTESYLCRRSSLPRLVDFAPGQLEPREGINF